MCRSLTSLACLSALPLVMFLTTVTEGSPEDGWTVKGLLLDPAGRHKSVRVTCTIKSPGVAPIVQNVDVSGSETSFQVQGTGKGQLTVSVVCQDGIRIQVLPEEGACVAPGVVLDVGRVRLPQAVLRVAAVSDAGRPVVNVQVFCFQGGFLRGEGLTDKNGRLVVGLWRSDPVRLKFEVPLGFALPRTPEVKPDGSVHTVVLRQLQAVRIRALIGERGPHFRGELTFKYRPSDRPESWTRTIRTSTGTVWLLPGKYTASVAFGSEAGMFRSHSMTVAPQSGAPPLTVACFPVRGASVIRLRRTGGPTSLDWLVTRVALKSASGSVLLPTAGVAVKAIKRATPIDIVLEPGQYEIEMGARLGECGYLSARRSIRVTSRAEPQAYDVPLRPAAAVRLQLPKGVASTGTRVYLTSVGASGTPLRVDPRSAPGRFQEVQPAIVHMSVATWWVLPGNYTVRFTSVGGERRVAVEARAGRTSDVR